MILRNHFYQARIPLILCYFSQIFKTVIFQHLIIRNNNVPVE